METAWLFDTLAVTVARIDFLDPEFASEPDIRERGVRVELRLLESKHNGSIYVSSDVALLPAVCRIDLLESAPGAADRMHWHPTMPDGEPGDRTFDPAIPADPTGWLAVQLSDVTQLLSQGGVKNLAVHAESSKQIAEHASAIVDAARAGLEWARRPWPTVDHDDRGMAIAAE